jgi:hypothetical protein
MNSVAVAGVVVGQWRQGGDYVIRLSVERGSDQRLELMGQGKGLGPDFVTIQLPSSLFSDGPVDFSQGQLIELVGQAGETGKRQKGVRSRLPQMMWRR